MKTIFTFLLISLFCFVSVAQAQSYAVRGRVLDQRDSSSVIGATIQLIFQSDSAKKSGTTSDIDGYFQIPNLNAGNYTIRVSYLGYATQERAVHIVSGDINVGTIRLKASSNVLQNVVVQAQQVRAQQMGDTTQFNAGAYKTNPDASAEDLVTKMPGVTSDNTGVKVNGETVQTVLVDGKPFFGDDPSLALKNLPAEVIDKIQVFDKLSDQSQFTGFDDGQSQKAINIITKRGKNIGEFGKVYAGYGTDDRYSAGASMNYFNGDQRISLIGLSNNINQQNFSAEDLLGVSGGSSGGRGGGYGGGGGSRGGGGSSSSNFLVGQQNGITKTNSIGLNYSDAWGKKIKVTGSYFFNQTDNTNSTQLTRNYFTNSDTAAQAYNELSNTETKNYNHRFNVRFEYTIDSFNSLIVTPKLSFQNNQYTTNLLGATTLGDAPAGATNNQNISNNTGYSFSNNILFRHRFAKKGRTVSLNIGTQLNEKNGDGKLYALNQYINDTTLLDQQYTVYSNGYTVSPSVVYTEPMGKKGQLMVNYSPSYTKNKSDKETYNFESADQAYTDLDTILSNKYDNTYITQKGGLSYRLGDKKMNFMAGVNYQYATLQGTQDFPYPLDISKPFSSVLPQAMFNYRFSQGTNLRVMYRTNTTAPNITQLQSVVDISNPLLLRTGNPNLKQDFENTLTIRYGKTKSGGGSNFFIYAYGSYIQDYIGNATLIPTKDSAFSNGITINRGSQLTLPVNLNNYFTGKTFVTYGIPVGLIKSNLNLNAGISYSHAPSLINNVENFSNSTTINGGFVLSSNISENVDFTLSYAGNYNIVKNTIQTQSDNSYYSHVVSAKLNYILFKRLVINTSLNENLYSGLGSAYDQNFFLWNAYIGYKFLKDHSLEARVSAYDILNQNKSISRNITDTYIEDSRTQVLTQYFMFTITYTLRHFKSGGMPTNTNNNGGPGDIHAPGGRPPYGGGGPGY
ncbi:TonB-dependent receptor [Taibaiella soli]|uniref:TonB-dependent receptor n=1 Tax=Taibaiella soli TaxID=1649169 RepID=A0A2W2BFM5_9BACT|nr:TonB-dependent receptor [Taibaiella soli]PZF74677.1 TonB-dependent receptor [Taibaiella soli]